jgi:hypothetical protein
VTALNKKILCFVDEHGTAGEPSFALGAVLVWARECGRLDKVFSDLLPASANEAHATVWKPSALKALLACLAQGAVPASLVMVNRRGDGVVGGRPKLYARALVETVKVGVRRFADRNRMRSRSIGNVDVIVDVNEQNSHPAFQQLIVAAQREHGRFRAVNRVVQLDSAASRVLQLADVVAHARSWIDRAEENAAGLRERYRIEVL